MKFVRSSGYCLLIAALVGLFFAACGDDGGSSVDPEQACEDYCANVESCTGSEDPNCVTNCLNEQEQAEQSFGASCGRSVARLAECRAESSCDELQTTTDCPSRRDAIERTCTESSNNSTTNNSTPNNTTPHPNCQNFCTKLDSCGADFDNCVGSCSQGYYAQADSDPTCANAMDSALVCFSNLSCAQIESESGCESEQAALDQHCDFEDSNNSGGGSVCEDDELYATVGGETGCFKICTGDAECGGGTCEPANQDTSICVGGSSNNSTTNNSTSGSISASCSDFCAKQDECDAADSGCESQCNDTYDAMESQISSACADAYQDAIDCFSSSTCSDIETGSVCETEQNTMEATCQ